MNLLHAKLTPTVLFSPSMALSVALLLCPVYFDVPYRKQRDKIKENKEKIKLNKQLPWLVGNVVEVRGFAML